LYKEMFRDVNVPSRTIDEAERLKVLDFREGRDACFYIVESSAGAGSYHGVSIWYNEGVFLCSCEQSVVRREDCPHYVSALIDLSRRYGEEWLKGVIKQNLFGVKGRARKSSNKFSLKHVRLQT